MLPKDPSSSLGRGLGLWVHPSWALLPARREITPVPHTGDVSGFPVSPGDARVSCSCSFLRSLLSAWPIRFGWGRVGGVGLVSLGSGSGWLWSSRPSCRRADGPCAPGTGSRGTFQGCQPLGAGRARDAPGGVRMRMSNQGWPCRRRICTSAWRCPHAAAVSPRSSVPHTAAVSPCSSVPHAAAVSPCSSVPHAVAVSPVQCHFPTRSHGDPRLPFQGVHASRRCLCHSI